jgi:hypothetical protein
VVEVLVISGTTEVRIRGSTYTGARIVQLRTRVGRLDKTQGRMASCRNSDHLVVTETSP